MSQSIPAGFLARLDARDRALFVRLAHDSRHAHPLPRVWMVITHAGGARASIGICLLSTLVPGVSIRLAWHSLLLLGVSHLIVQIVKRFAGRPRPSSSLHFHALIAVPDRFSFPSGHACAAMSVAVAYAWTFPLLAIPLLLVALAVGASRVVLAVHYPGDVVMGQAIALVTAYAMHAFVG